MTFSAQPPDLHRLNLGRESFAVTCPLALFDSASYPVSVRRLADSLAASFSGPLTVAALRFTWIATTNSPEDSHPQAIIHAGHAKKPLASAYSSAAFRSISILISQRPCDTSDSVNSLCLRGPPAFRLRHP